MTTEDTAGAPADGLTERVAGTLRYTIDAELPGMLHAALARSPLPSARIRAVDSRRAAAMPGVRLVVTGADLQKLALADTRFGTIVPDQPILATDRVRHVGEPVAAVLAATPAAAWAAAAAIELDLDPIPGVFDQDAALEPSSPLIHEAKPGNVLGRVSFVNGDLAAAEAATVHRFVGEYESPAAQQVTFEPQVCLATWHDGSLELWAATQSPSRVAAELARIFGLSEDRVRLHVPPLGGGYGAKNHAKLEPLVAALSALAGRPVRLLNRRAEEFITTTKHPARVWIESGVDADGQFTFRRARVRWSAGAYAHSSPAVMRAGLLAVCGPYRVPAAEVESVMAYTNLPPAGSFRGLGANQAAWAGERQVDEISHALRIDPVDFRRRNVVRDGDRLPMGERVTGAHWLECLESAAAALQAASDRPSTSVGTPSRDRPVTGIGVALAMKHTMTPSRSEAVVAALQDGSIEVRSSLVDMGQGLPGVLSRAAADTLEIPLERVRWVTPDTHLTPFDATTSSSRGTWSGTHAVRHAALELRGTLESLAAGHMEAPIEAVAYRAGRVEPAETSGGTPDSGPTIAELVTASGLPEVNGHGIAINEAPVDAESGATASSSHWHQGAVAVQVEVDPETGVCRVVEAAGTAWAGEVISVRGAGLQNEGNILFGLGPALFESLRFPGGYPDQTSLLEYRIPSILDLPERLVTTSLEAPASDPQREPTGLGESLIPAVAPAIAAAVADATGVTFRRLPLDPPAILDALLGGEGVEPVPSRDASGRISSDPHLPYPVGPTDITPEQITVRLTVNGRPEHVLVDPLTSLREVLGEILRVRSVREPCGVGVCGACTVLSDGVPLRSCLRPAGLAEGSAIVTSEGLAEDDPVRAAFIKAGAAQCGYCIPGAVLATKGLLETSPGADADAVRDGLSGNLCRCGTSARIVDAAHAAGATQRGG